MKDIPRRWHQTYSGDANAKPIFLGLSGLAIPAFLAGIVFSIALLWCMTQLLKASLLPSLAVAAVVPALILGVLRKFYVGKPTNFAAHYSEYQKIKKSNGVLLSHFSNDEDS